MIAPRSDCGEGLRWKGQLGHVGALKTSCRHIRLRAADLHRRDIHTGHIEAGLSQQLRHRHAVPAAEVEHCAAGWDDRDQLADPLRICCHGWVVELERIPASTNVMATYEAVVDFDGNVVEYARVRRYHRNQVDGNDG